MKNINYVYEATGAVTTGKLSSVIDRSLQAQGFDYLIVDGKHCLVCDIIDSIQKIEGDFDYILVSLPMTALFSSRLHHLN